MYFDRIRKDIGLTRRQLAKYVDVQTKDVKEWEDGVSLPDKEHWGKIEEAIKTSLDQVEFPMFRSLFEIRTSLGLTQTQFGDLIGVSLTTVNISKKSSLYIIELGKFEFKILKVTATKIELVKLKVHE